MRQAARPVRKTQLVVSDVLHLPGQGFPRNRVVLLEPAMRAPSLANDTVSVPMWHCR
ncbi:MAG: hypothetical protein ACRDMY_01060 [Gaiellaceae bacterium]